MSAPDTAAGRGQGPFSPRNGLLIALVGVFAFSALVVLSAYAPDLRGGQNGGANALSRSAIGYAGIARALKMQGDIVIINRTRVRGAAGVGLMVVTPPPGADENDVTALGFEGPILIVLPKWEAAPDFLHPGWVRKAVPIEKGFLPKSAFLADRDLARRSGVSRPVLRGLKPPFGLGETLTPGPVDRMQTLAPNGWQAVLVDDAGATVLAKDPERPVYLLSDPDLLNTHGLKDADTFGVALSLLHGLRGGDGPILFDVRLNGYSRERSVLRLLFEPPFLAVTLCLAAAAALAGFQTACRFGPVRRAPRAVALGKQALVDNSAALIRLARREPRMGGRYADIIRDLAARAVGAPRELTGEALVAFLDRLGRQRGAREPLSTLAAEARAVTDRDRLTAAARKLYRWRLEMTRERS